MKTEIRHENNLTIVSVHESVDALTAVTLGKSIHDEIDHGHIKLIVDMTAVDFMSSAGLRTLLGAVKEARSAGGDLCIVSSNPGVDKIFTLSGFHTVASVFATTAEAVASFG